MLSLHRHSSTRSGLARSLQLTASLFLGTPTLHISIPLAADPGESLPVIERQSHSLETWAQILLYHLEIPSTLASQPLTLGIVNGPLANFQGLDQREGLLFEEQRRHFTSKRHKSATRTSAGVHLLDQAGTESVWLTTTPVQQFADVKRNTADPDNASSTGSPESGACSHCSFGQHWERNGGTAYTEILSWRPDHITISQVANSMSSC